MNVISWRSITSESDESMFKYLLYHNKYTLKRVLKYIRPLNWDGNVKCVRRSMVESILII